MANSYTKDDFHDAIREMIKHEDFLLNERVKILISLQVLLFGVVAVFWNQNSIPQGILCLVGICISQSYLLDIINGNKALASLKKTHMEYLVSNNIKKEDYPPIIGLELQKSDVSFLPGDSLPKLFRLMWFCIALYTLVKFIFNL